MDYYKSLGIEKNASEQEIKRVYRKLAKKYHPDKGEGGNEKKFKEVTEAYEILGDKQKRSQYDQFESAEKQNFGGQGFGGFDFGGFENVNVDFGEGFGDIFDNFFGGGGRRTGQKRGPIQGGDIEIVIRLTFEEAIFGTSKDVEISRYETCEHCKGNEVEPGTKLKNCNECSGTGQKVKIQRTPLGQIQTSASCQTCKGTGQIAEHKCKKCNGEGRVLKNSVTKIKIPAGIHDQAVIRLKGKGEAGTKGGSYGDMFVHISITSSREFERIKNDIYTQLHIHVLQAILGDEIKVPTIHGKITLKIPAGTESGKVFKIKEYGVPKINTNVRGDHYVKIKIDIPQKLSKKEKESYKKLAEESKLSIKPNNKGFFQ